MNPPSLIYQQLINLFVELLILDAPSDMLFENLPNEENEATRHLEEEDYRRHAQRMGISEEDLERRAKLRITLEQHPKGADHATIRKELASLNKHLLIKRLKTVKGEIKKGARDRNPILNIDYYLELDKQLEILLNRTHPGELTRLMNDLDKEAKEAASSRPKTKSSKFTNLIREALAIGPQSDTELRQWKEKFNRLPGSYFDRYAIRMDSYKEGAGSENGLEWRRNPKFHKPRSKKSDV